MFKAFAAGLATAGMVFCGTYLLNESLWSWIPIGSSLMWASAMALVAFGIGFEAQRRPHF